MKRFGILPIILVILSVVSCGTLPNVATSTKVNVQILTDKEEYDITPSKSEENAQEINVTSNNVKVNIFSEGHKIAYVIQDGYFEEETGFYTGEEVYFCFTKLPAFSCSYSTGIPKGDNFEVQIELENGEIFYFTLTRETWRKKNVWLMKINHTFIYILLNFKYKIKNEYRIIRKNRF